MFQNNIQTVIDNVTVTYTPTEMCTRKGSHENKELRKKTINSSFHYDHSKVITFKFFELGDFRLYHLFMKFLVSFYFPEIHVQPWQAVFVLEYIYFCN